MRDALEVLDLTLTLPIGGKTYTVNPPTAAVGVRLSNLLARGIVLGALSDHFEGSADLEQERASLVLEGDVQVDFARDCLGAVYDEMLADGVTAPAVELAVSTAFLAWTVGKVFAEGWWESGGKPPAPTTPSRSGPRTVTPTHSAVATTTQTPGSRSGTKRTRRKGRKGSR